MRYCGAKMPPINKNLLEQREEKCDGDFEAGELHRHGLYEHNWGTQVEINFLGKDDFFFFKYM